MDEHGQLTAPDTIRFERLLPGPIERVWGYLTDPAKRALWLAGGPMELKVGGRVEQRFRHAELSPEPCETPERYRREADTPTVGRVTACEPPHLLSYTWDELTPNTSEVTFELSAEGERVRLVLTHRRLVGRRTKLGVAGGWHRHLAILEDRLEGRDPPAFWPLFERLERDYDAQLPPE